MNSRQASKIVNLRTADYRRWLRLPWRTRVQAGAKLGIKYRPWQHSPYGVVSVKRFGRYVPIGNAVSPCVHCAEFSPGVLPDCKTFSVEWPPITIEMAYDPSQLEMDALKRLANAMKDPNV